jgi:hypothetical protein
VANGRRCVELSSDPTIRSHLAALYDTLLEQNLLRIVEPYSVVELAHVATQVGQGQQEIEAKLSQMILDKVLHGVLDQGRGCLVLYDEPETDVRTFFSSHILFRLLCSDWKLLSASAAFCPSAS